mgnify:FL=1
MSEKVTFDYSRTAPFINAGEVEMMSRIVGDAKDVLVGRTAAGSDFLGWIELPVDYDK